MKSQGKWVIVFLLSGSLGFLTSLYVHRHFSNADHEQTMQTFHSPVSFVKQLKNDPEAGKKIFKEFCASCHAEDPLIEVNAPKINDKKTWDALRQSGMSTLLKITITGVGAMPARGGCFECSDEQLQKTIQYICTFHQ